MAVGVLINPNFGVGELKGKAVAVWNFLGDKLWQLGCRKVGAALFLRKK